MNEPFDGERPIVCRCPASRSLTLMAFVGHERPFASDRFELGLTAEVTPESGKSSIGRCPTALSSEHPGAVIGDATVHTGRSLVNLLPGVLSEFRGLAPRRNVPPLRG